MDYPDDSLFGAPMARNTDPVTSHLGALDVKPRAGSQAMLLLEQYALEPLTDEEAGYNSKLAMRPKCCYWKRCSDLRDFGLIAPNGTKRMSSAGSLMMVCEITPAGRRALTPTTESNPT